MNNTGIFIRAKVDGAVGTYDIGDPRVPSLSVVSWLRSKGGRNILAENTVLVLLGRKRIAGSCENHRGSYRRRQ